MIIACQSEDDYRRLLDDSHVMPILLLKHSTRCPISAAAEREFTRFAAEAAEGACRQVLVVEQRPLSQQIAQETGVVHQSPQVLLFKDGKVVWHATHYSITAEAMRAAYNDGTLPVNR